MDTKAIAEEISIAMPVIARRVLLEFFEQNDIPQTQLLTIMAIFAVGKPVRLTDLSKQMNVSPPTITGIVDRLEKGKYVKRSPDPEDRRAIRVNLTLKGEDVAKQFRSTVKAKWIELLSSIKLQDQKKFLEIIREIRSNV